MKRIPDFCVSIFVLLLLSTNLFAQSNKIIRSTVEPKLPSVATLYGLDPLAHTLCFRDGQDGSIVQQNVIYNRCSDLDFSYYNAGNLSVGVEGGRIGTIVDLGTADELKQRYGNFERGTAAGQIFVSLRIENENVVILKGKNSVQSLKESTELLADGKPLATTPVKLGHIYLVRITDRHDKAFQLIAKMLVVAHVPNESVSIRWQVL